MPSTTDVPEVLTHAGFGQPDAECEVDPQLGLYYLALTWDRAVASARVDTFEAQLHDAGFRQNPGTTADTFTAPKGVRAVVGGVPSDMQKVTVVRSAKDRLTAIIWI